MSRPPFNLISDVLFIYEAGVWYNSTTVVKAYFVKKSNQSENLFSEYI